MLRISRSPRPRVAPSPRQPSPRQPSPRLLFYVANRAHHADIGGATPGSMGLATDIYGEGIRIPPIRLVRNGLLDSDTMRLLLANVRGNVERRGDFDAQIGSLKTGATRLLEIIERRGEREATEYAAQLIDYSARMMRHTIASIPNGVYEAEDALDDDGVDDRPVRIAVRIEIRGERATVDFSGSAPQVTGAINAVEAITVSAVSYVVECEDAVWRTDEIVSLPRGFRLTATASPEFHPRGNVAPTATLIVWNAHSKSKRVVVNITGRVRVD